MKYPFNISTWPKPNPDLEAALGRFIIAWNVLEQQMEFAIHEICELSHPLGLSVTANLGTKAKLDMYMSTAHCYGELIGKETLSSVESLVSDTGNAGGHLRNFVVHGQPWIINLMEEKAEFWIKYSARKGGPKGMAIRLSADGVDGYTQDIRDLVERWVRVRKIIYDTLDSLDFD